MLKVKPENISKNLEWALAMTTFPTKPENADIYIEGLAWRAFNPSVPFRVQERILGLLHRGSRKVDRFDLVSV